VIHQTNKPPKQDIHGWLVLDKPTGITSAAAVARVKKVLQCKKIGHGGTLDPLASGILPLALGEATKLFDYVVSEKKTYQFEVTWGQERDTDDSEGRVVASSENRPSREQIQCILPEFTGVILQTPPDYSAIKIGGERAYALARAGNAVTIQPREVEIDVISIVSHDDSGKTLFHATCGKGTYVRALARDFGRKLNCLGYISSLRRTAVGAFRESLAISLEKLEEIGHNAALTQGVVALESMLDDILAIDVDLNQSAKLRRGQPVFMFKSTGAEEGSILAVKEAGKLVALGEVKGRLIQPVRVFNH
jgi:tRNA pseudouridine55 synthase